MTHVIIVGGGFAGLTAAKTLAQTGDVRVTLIDRQNHHLFQPLLYQVAMAGLSPSEIAAPIRGLLSRFKNVTVLQGNLESVELHANKIRTDFGELSFDYLLLACGAEPSYFGKDAWERFAPSLKTLPQATEIRRRVLASYETAERTDDTELRRRLLTFVVIGGGPTGVELAGAIGEMSRFTLAKDFRNIDPTLARVILVEAGDRILPSFDEGLANRASRDLESLGVQIWANSRVSDIDDAGVQIGDERIQSSTVIWAAGVKGVEVCGVEGTPGGRITVNEDLSLPGHPNVFVAGDQANFAHQTGRSLPGIAPVAMQQGRFVGNAIANELQGRERGKFHFVDKGQMATIGRSRAVVEVGRCRFAGWFAWLTWLVVHIYFLVGFKNRFFVVLNWAWSYVTFKRGARLIIQPVGEPAQSSISQSSIGSPSNPQRSEADSLR